MRLSNVGMMLFTGPPNRPGQTHSWTSTKSHPHYDGSLFERDMAGIPIGGTLSPMRPLRYSINVTLDGCCDHRAMLADEDLHRHAVENLDQADALLFGRVTYEMMEAAWRPPAPDGSKA